ncbi:hypothetical protein B0T19DRAFT_214103 [Cercophora scortea]|uniref:Uncharacterized protein n=1 Tax=Cercophora scortea TaxID=314031 RepID=A0AAE0MAD4_9PEZI|nr:hypothetical protein B0T19DRAFT_214103 [Cercophora scortea]
MRSFSTSARQLLKLHGYPLHNLPKPRPKSATTYLKNGAVKKVGKVVSAEILFRKDGSSPVHKSGFNPNDPEETISVIIEDENGNKKIHHIYEDGTGTSRVGDDRE